MPPKTEQEAIKEILNYLAEKPNIKQQYLEFLENSKNHYYSHSQLVDKLGFIKQRFNNFLAKETDLINHTELFVKTAHLLKPGDYQESKFSVDALIKKINESVPSNSPTNPDSEAGMPERGNCPVS